jgi:competence protein ComEC
VTSGHPLVGPALGFLVGITAGLQGLPRPPGLPLGLGLALSPPLAPLAFACAGWLVARPPASPAAAPARPVPPPPPPAATPSRAREVRVLEGRVASVPERSGERVRFRLVTPDAVLDTFAPPTPWPLALGDRIRLRAELRTPAVARNPGGRDPASRLAAAGVFHQAFAEGPAVRTAAPSPLAQVERVRARFAAAAWTALPPREAGLVVAIATGDRSGLDAATTASFARSGLAHILAVSGLHLVVVAIGLERLLRAGLLRLDAVAARVEPRRAAAAVLLPATAVYAVATGAGVPVLRAALAVSVAALGTLLDREAPAANVLALAALAFLAADPSTALDVSAQLTFTAVAGLVLWSGPLRRRLPVPPARRGWRAWILEPLLSGACATAAASVATAPVLAFHFRQLPILGLAANVAGIPVGSALTAIATLAAVAAPLSVAAAEALLLPARPLASVLLALSDAAAAPSCSVLGVASPGLAGAAGFLALAVVAGRLRGTRRFAAVLGAAACLLAPGPLRAAAARARGGLEVLFVSVGQGDGAVLRLPDGSAVLIDAGGTPDGGADPGARDVVPLLRDLGVRRLSAAFVSHPHPDHVLGLAAVTAAIPADLVFSNGDAGDGAARDVLAALRPTPLAPGARWERAGVRFEVHGGAREPLAPNDASLVLRVVYGDTAFLFPGDLEVEGEAAAVAAGGLAADVVKVPHHGSRRSSTAPFTAAVRPRLAVASVGAGNRYGFPHEEALARWREAGAFVLRTDEGAIRLLSDGRRVRRVAANAALDPLAIRRERTQGCGVRIEDLDLDDVAERLRRHIPEGEPPVGYLRGRSYFRDVLAHELGCSELEAEELVDTLEMNGYLRFEGDPSVRSRAESRWDIETHRR